MRMITACFARVSLRCTRRTPMPIRLIIQGVRPISKTRNQLISITQETCPLNGYNDRKRVET
jgi:hypothetical protein